MCCVSFDKAILHLSDLTRVMPELAFCITPWALDKSGSDKIILISVMRSIYHAYANDTWRYKYRRYRQDETVETSPQINLKSFIGIDNVTKPPMSPFISRRLGYLF